MCNFLICKVTFVTLGFRLDFEEVNVKLPSRLFSQYGGWDAAYGVDMVV